MSGGDHNQLPASQIGSDSPGELGEPPAPVDFALRILQRVGIPRDRYDTYVRLDTAAGGLFVAFTPELVTGAVLATGGLTAERFEELHRSRTGRSAIPTGTPLPGLLTALRTGRVRRLSLDLGPVDALEARVLRAVQTIPAGQLRPLSWLTREAALPPARGADAVLNVLAHNPFVVLVPCHRVTYEHGAPCDAAYLPAAGDALRSAEGVDMAEVHQWSRSGAVFLGSDTTHIYCHPTCANARRITPAHRVPFTNAREARRAGYRACKSCRPVAA
ncbi:MGMT family protein [Micromonospora sp. C28SCA-DRY-2]|uniref:MGMT family protein n=1 Tax=Micromonospora sp. C28SCA-DRY-2 TaxID=3059522 RepID=UPI0026771A91|nr:MGMT family protein [Micromonospora sp. C28SCA-DRY-2]MDO3700276.1 MGMT family protein [Micromonospora sp. C28SCA-DRY-2]